MEQFVDPECPVSCWIGETVTVSSSDAPRSVPDVRPASRIVRLIGVYDADATFRGELSYWLGARLGRRHCALCDITHGSVRERPEWATCRSVLPIPFDTFHRNDQPAEVRDAAGGQAPVVVAETDGHGLGFVLLLSRDDLDGCDGSIEQLMAAVEGAAVRLGLDWSVS